MEINEMLKETIESIKNNMCTENIIGEPLTNGETVILPVMKVSFGFVVGSQENSTKSDNEILAKGGATAGGLNITPVGFLICGKEKKFISIDGEQDSKWKDLLKATINTFKSED